MTEGEQILVAGALLASGLLASLVAGQVRVPSLVFFLGLGMLIGDDGFAFIPFDNYELARFVGIIALSLILFEGGLAAGLPEIKPVLGPAVSLALVGTLVTAALTGVAAWLLIDPLTLDQGLLLGAILASTDGAAVFAVLRGSTLRRRLARALEGESGLNDPIAVLLVLGFIERILHPGYGFLDFLELFARQIAIGAGIGALVGAGAVLALRYGRFATGGLYPVATLATAALAFGGADALHGSGFLAVYLAGLALGTWPPPAQQTIQSFHEGMSWVAQLTMFLVLGLLVFPSQLDDVAVEGTILAVVLAVVARPVAAWLATLPFGFTFREQIVLGWAGLRGAVPVVLATFPVIDGVPGSHDLFTLVFFAVLLSTVLQGSTFEGLARRLGVTTSEPALPRPLADSGTIRSLGAEVAEYPVVAGDAIVGLAVRDLGLPREAVVNVIVREGEAIPPRGSTRILAGDRLHILYREEAARTVMGLTRGWRTGPVGPQPRPPRVVRGSTPIFVTRGWTPADGDATRPDRVTGREVVDVLRLRRDAPGSLSVLDDGRYAIAGAVLAVGARRAVLNWATFRMRNVGPEERAWLRTVIGALAADAAESPSFTARPSDPRG